MVSKLVAIGPGANDVFGSGVGDGDDVGVPDGRHGGQRCCAIMRVNWCMGRRNHLVDRRCRKCWWKCWAGRTCRRCHGVPR